MIDFDFINDETFRNVLKRDYAEVELCIQSKAFKSVLVLTGSIIESVLLDYYCSIAADSAAKEKILKYDLHKLIELAHDDRILSQRAKDLSSVIRNYRNLIHPGREIRERETVDEESAVVAISLTKIVLKEIREYILRQYGYTANDIFGKLHSDIHASAIYEQLIQKISTSERIKLLKAITDNETLDDEQSALHKEIKNPKKLINTLKPYVPKEIIREQVMILVDLVSKGKTSDILPMYNLYHQDLDLLPKNDRELVIVYILAYLYDSLNTNAFTFFSRERTLADIGKFIKTPKTADLLLSLIRKFVINYDFKKDPYNGLDVLEQVLNSLDGGMKDDAEKLIDEMSDFLKEDYLTAKKIKDDLPF